MSLNVPPFEYDPAVAAKASNPNRRRKWLIPVVLAAQVRCPDNRAALPGLNTCLQCSGVLCAVLLDPNALLAAAQVERGPWAAAISPWRLVLVAIRHSA